eukprot:12321038-Prorocentrum_lima.AAC.1
MQTHADKPHLNMLSEEALYAHATPPEEGKSGGKTVPDQSPSKASAGSKSSGRSSAAGSEGLLQLSEEEMAL